jgi:hypothetical protein
MIAIGDPRQADAVMVGEAMPPLRQYFPPLLKGRDAHVRTQTSAIPAPPDIWLNCAVCGDQEGAEGVRFSPLVATCRRRPCPRCGSTSLACEGRRAHGGPQRERSLAVLERLEAGAEGPPVRDQERRVDRDDALLALDDVEVDEEPGSPER